MLLQSTLVPLRSTKRGVCLWAPFAAPAAAVDTNVPLGHPQLVVRRLVPSVWVSEGPRRPRNSPAPFPRCLQCPAACCMRPTGRRRCRFSVFLCATQSALSVAGGGAGGGAGCGLWAAPGRAKRRCGRLAGGVWTPFRGPTAPPCANFRAVLSALERGRHGGQNGTGRTSAAAVCRQQWARARLLPLFFTAAPAPPCVHPFALCFTAFKCAERDVRCRLPRQ